MNESNEHPTNDPDPGIHEATAALQHLADEVEQERVAHGRSSVDPPPVFDEGAMAAGAPAMEDKPDAGEPSGHDHESEATSIAARLEGNVAAVARPVPNRAQNPY